MLVVLKENSKEVGCEAARIVASSLRANPKTVLGLATGSTPLGMYEELISLHKSMALIFRRPLLSISMSTRPRTRQTAKLHYFMHSNFFSK